MTKQSNLNIVLSWTLSLLIAAGSSLAAMGRVHAEGIPNYKRGTFFVSGTNENGDPDLKYVVKKGDSFSSISRKTCQYYGEEGDTKYWPVIVDENGVKTIHPGDIVDVPDSYQEMVDTWGTLNSNGKVSEYKRIYYHTNKRYLTVKELIKEIYKGKGVVVNDEFINKFLTVQRIQGSDKNTIVDMEDGNQVIIYTEWIPTPEQIDYYYDQMTKTKKRR